MNTNVVDFVNLCESIAHFSWNVSSLKALQFVVDCEIYTNKCCQ